MNGLVTKDWRQWHRHYDTPDSSLSYRLEAVRRYLRQALASAPGDADGVVRLTSICAGEGRDVLPVLAGQDSGRPVKAILIEFDPVLAQRAATTTAGLGLSGVEIKIADAGKAETYLTVPQAHVLLACGIFGNISAADMRRTVATLPELLAAGGIVIWTRGTRNSGRDPSLDIRACLSEHGFTELSFTTTRDGVFRIGMHRLATEPAARRPPQAGTRMFTFV